MIDIRCKNCDKLLAKAHYMNGAIKCSRCYMIFEYRVYPNTLTVNEMFDMNTANDIIPTETKSPGPKIGQPPL